MTGPADILRFWFEDVSPQEHFNGGDALDAKIRQHFEAMAVDLAADVAMGQSPDWAETPNGALALVIVLDQFSRNMYRGTPGAFAWDGMALASAKQAVDAGWDLKQAQNRRAFFYMPFMHSENLADQDRCVALVDSRLDDSHTLHHAKAHRRLIERFGRFPHRNAILGRTSSPEERVFLKNGGYAP